MQMKSLSNKKSEKKSNVLSKDLKKINQSNYIPKYKVKSIQKMKTKHRSRINDRIDEISDAINKLHGYLKELSSEHGDNYVYELKEDFVYEEKEINIEDSALARYMLHNSRLGMLGQILFRCQKFFREDNTKRIIGIDQEQI